MLFIVYSFLCTLTVTIFLVTTKKIPGMGSPLISPGMLKLKKTSQDSEENQTATTEEVRTQKTWWPIVCQHKLCSTAVIRSFRCFCSDSVQDYCLS